MLRLALVGAAGSGRSRLQAELDAALSARGVPCSVDDATAAVHAAGRAPQALAAFGTAHRARYRLTLLLGLDLPAAPDAGRQQADQALRALLAQSGIGYQVVYGLGPARAANALHAIDRMLAPAQRGSGRRLPDAALRACEKCSDPQCEHRLFTDLLARRAAPP